VTEQDQIAPIEPRWPVALAVLVSLFLFTVLPGRIKILPTWAPNVVGVLVIIPIAAVELTKPRVRWQRVERFITLFFFIVAAITTLAGLANLIILMVGRSGAIGGGPLLASSIAIWVTNVLMFSMLYWQLDRGGPEARENNASPRPDWLFPQQGAGDDVPPGWGPTFVDYLFLGFSTATAFSPTDVLPLTRRAKMLMMLESAISLVTTVAVASRAINILGS
jgi:hypothetical protein